MSSPPRGKALVSSTGSTPVCALKLHGSQVITLHDLRNITTRLQYCCPRSTSEAAWAQPQPAVEAPCWASLWVRRNWPKGKNQQRVTGIGFLRWLARHITYDISSSKWLPPTVTPEAFLREDTPLICCRVTVFVWAATYQQESPVGCTADSYSNPNASLFVVSQRSLWSVYYW